MGASGSSLAKTEAPSSGSRASRAAMPLPGGKEREEERSGLREVKKPATSLERKRRKKIECSSFSISISNLSLLPINPIVNPTGLRLRARSKTATRVPGAARSIASAAARPPGPPPTMATSTKSASSPFLFLVAAALATTPLLSVAAVRLVLLLCSRPTKLLDVLCAPRSRAEGEKRGKRLYIALSRCLVEV